MAIELDRQIGDFLAAHHVMSLATVNSKGPHATNLFYACDGLALIWVSEPDTQHSRDIEADPRAAATVAPDYSDFAAIRGVQIVGEACRIVGADDRMRYLAQLEARYLFLRQLAAGPSKLRQAYARTAVYRLQPIRIVLIDNTKGFGHKETLDISVDRG
ncbi:MAG TPA: pyridoxamine 5'-phosphate oxidase family protein [Pseudolabrys sp.]|nr:pyridoxamine 5'-phosphate oxidase family protein [Pseudolabrys sp.]